MKLKTQPHKDDGFMTTYDCGLDVTGGWSTRLEKHREFIDSPMGQYILKLEEENENQLDALIRINKAIDDQELNDRFGHTQQYVRDAIDKSQS